MDTSGPAHVSGVSLVEELCLLAIDDDGSVTATASEPAFGMGVVGACLVELEWRDRVRAAGAPPAAEGTAPEATPAAPDGDEPEVMLEVVDATPTGEPVVDRVLEVVSAGPPRSTGEWTRQIFPEAGGLVDLALARLQARGIIEEREASFLWVLKSRRYPVIEGKELQEAKLRITEVLLGGQEPTRHDSVLIGLASISGLLAGFLSGAELRRLEARIAEVSCLDSIARSVEDAIEEEIAFRARAMMVPHM